MKLYLSHSSSFDYRKELYKPLKSTLSANLNVFFPHDKGNVGTKSQDIIAESDYLLAEVSFPSTGQGIEIGWADTNNIPIICFYRSGSKISSSLRFVTDVFLEYSSEQEMTSKLNEWLDTQSLGSNKQSWS
jgi:hypothetical protein